MRVWDSTAEVRYLVLPERPPGTEAMTEDATRGAGDPRLDDRRGRGGRAMNGVHDMGGMHGFGPVVREQNEPVWHAPWEARMFALAPRRCMGAWPIDAGRAANRADARRGLSALRAITRNGFMR